ncbi:MAG: hypothetical protein E7396_00570 [Ruminococcaceae bacterium]|nr:hypothetical protein [Oscillospiraceae bacterium]
MKINIKKFVFGTVATMAAATLVFTSALASETGVAEENTDTKPEIHQKHRKGHRGFAGKGRRDFFIAELTEEQKAELKEKFSERKELTEEQKAELKEKFGERKELTEEEKAQMKEKMEERKAEMEAKMAEKEAERKAKLDEKLANGEITQEQYDKMIEKKPGQGREKMKPGKGKGFGRGKGRCPEMKKPDMEASIEATEETVTEEVTEEATA